MTSSTPLPEQGGFDERLEGIIRTMSIKLTVPATMTGKVPENLYEIENEAEQSIRTLVLEEIIGEDEYSGQFSTSDPREEYYIGRDELRSEQRKKLGGTHGTK